MLSDLFSQLSLKKLSHRQYVELVDDSEKGEAVEANLRDFHSSWIHEWSRSPAWMVSTFALALILLFQFFVGHYSIFSETDFGRGLVGEFSEKTMCSLLQPLTRFRARSLSYKG
jgi:hypothetical protein